MNARPPELFSVGVVLLFFLGACASPPPAGTSGASAATPHVPDVRTESLLVQMENQYLADKNSQPTHQHEAEAEQRKKEEEKKRQQAEAQAKAEAVK